MDNTSIILLSKVNFSKRIREGEDEATTLT